MPAGEDIVGPRQTLALGAASPTLARVAARARVGLVLDGVRQPYPQDVLFTPTDPLTLSEAPLTTGRVQMQIDDPAGTVFLGS